MQGQKTSPETIYAILACWAVTDSYAETARMLNLPPTTVEKIVKEHKDDPEFVELCANKRKKFVAKADAIIDKTMNRLEREIDNEDKEIPVNHLTNVIGMMYEKKALAEGNETSRVSVEIKLPPEADDYAG